MFVWEEHPPCPPGIECPCASAMCNRLLRELLEAMGWDVPARPEAPRMVWAEAIQRIKATHPRAEWWRYGVRTDVLVVGQDDH